MKTSEFFFIALAFFLTCSAFGQRRLLTKPLAEKPSVSITPGFTVDLIVHNCPMKGHFAEAVLHEESPYPIISNEDKRNLYYTYFWVVDGIPAGTAESTACTLGFFATVYVTQQPKGKTISKSVMMRMRTKEAEPYLSDRRHLKDFTEND